MLLTFFGVLLSSSDQIAFRVLVRALMSVGPGDELLYLKREFREFIAGLICLPVNLPGTTLYKSLKVESLH